MTYSYAEVGATRSLSPDTLPRGYSYVHRRMHVGRHVFAEAVDHVMTWRMYRALPVTVLTDLPRVTEGTDVVVVLGAGRWGVRAPCRIVWTLDEDMDEDRAGRRRAGFAYGTLDGHPESGEEAFVVEEDEGGDTWLTVMSFSRPVAWYAKLGGPVTRVFQRAFVRRCGQVLRRLSAEGTGLTYPEVGATRGGELPAGYVHVRERMSVGRGMLAEATEHLMTWRMYREAGVTVQPAVPRVTEGTGVLLVLGPGVLGKRGFVLPSRWGIRNPCRVVWTLAEEHRTGFAYGTLRGHPMSGEQSFVLEEDSGGETRLTVTSFSRPVAWYMKLAGPVRRRLQRALVRRCGRVLRRLCAAGTGLTYPEVGATRSAELPRGYGHIVERGFVGRGVLAAATEQLMSWDMFRAAGVVVRPSAPRVAEGVDVTVMLPLPVVPLRVPAPNRVVWTLNEERSAGFAFGTLPGHPGTGEAAFLLEEDEHGDVWLSVRSFSRLVAWYARLGTPVARWHQRRTSRRYAPALRRLCER